MSGLSWAQTLLLNAQFILKWQIALLGEEKCLKVAGRDSKMCRNAAGRTSVVWGFYVKCSHVLRTWKRYMEDTKGKCEASSHLTRAPLTAHYHPHLTEHGTAGWINHLHTPNVKCWGAIFDFTRQTIHFQSIYADLVVTSGISAFSTKIRSQ